MLVLTSNTTFSFAFGLVRGFAWNVLLTTESECERGEITLPPSFPGIEKIYVKTLLISKSLGPNFFLSWHSMR